MATPTRGINHTPIHVGSIRKNFVKISTANTLRDGTGTTVNGFTASDQGSRVARVDFKATGPTTAGMIRIFRDEGANRWLIAEVEVTAITPSAVLKSYEGGWTPNGTDGELLTSGQSLYFSTHNAEEFVVSVTAGDY